jgi:four helix bundle protein
MRDETLADELQNRLIDFAVRIINVADALPSSPAGRHISGQILRCGTSPAPNYAEARGAESRADFVHKLKIALKDKIALKELNETSVWLRVIGRAQLLKPALLTPLTEENQQLSRILNASISTVKRASQNDQAVRPDNEVANTINESQNDLPTESPVSQTAILSSPNDQ